MRQQFPSSAQLLTCTVPGQRARHSWLLFGSSPCRRCTNHQRIQRKSRPSEPGRRSLRVHVSTPGNAARPADVIRRAEAVQPRRRIAGWLAAPRQIAGGFGPGFSGGTPSGGNFKGRMCIVHMISASRSCDANSASRREVRALMRARRGRSEALSPRGGSNGAPLTAFRTSPPERMVRLSS